MNIIYFSNGGFVAHRIGNMRLSAWYDAQGNVLAFEKIGAWGNVVRINNDDRSAIRVVGRLYRQTAQNNVYLRRKARASLRRPQA